MRLFSLQNEHGTPSSHFCLRCRHCSQACNSVNDKRSGLRGARTQTYLRSAHLFLALNLKLRTRYRAIAALRIVWSLLILMAVGWRTHIRLLRMLRRRRQAVRHAIWRSICGMRIHRRRLRWLRWRMCLRMLMLVVLRLIGRWRQRRVWARLTRRGRSALARRVVRVCPIHRRRRCMSRARHGMLGRVVVLLLRLRMRAVMGVWRVLERREGRRARVRRKSRRPICRMMLLDGGQRGTRGGQRLRGGRWVGGRHRRLGVRLWLRRRRLGRRVVVVRRRRRLLLMASVDMRERWVRWRGCSEGWAPTVVLSVHYVGREPGQSRPTCSRQAKRGAMIPSGASTQRSSHAPLGNEEELAAAESGTELRPSDVTVECCELRYLSAKLAGGAAMLGPIGGAAKGRCSWNGGTMERWNEWTGSASEASPLCSRRSDQRRPKPCRGGFGTTGRVQPAGRSRRPTLAPGGRSLHLKRKMPSNLPPLRPRPN